MFIRETIKSNKGYKKQFVYHLLVESYRTENGPRQRVLLDLGKLFIPKDKWKVLANRIEEIVNGQTSLFEIEPEIEILAIHYANLLINKNLNKQKDLQDNEPDYEEIDVNSVKTSNLRTVGAEYACNEMLKKIGLPEVLLKSGLSDKQMKIAKLPIIGRMVYPASEFATYKWARSFSAIGELLGINIEEISHNLLYKVSDLLIKYQEEIEEHLSKNERGLFSLNEKIILYDLTNTYFESSKTSALKKYGRSKEKRNDQPLVTLGLVMDENGFPKQSHIFEGNVAEPHTFERVLDKLDKMSKGNESKTIIMDAGISTEDNLNLIKSRGHDYIVVARNKPLEQIPDEGFVRIEHSQQGMVEARLLKQQDEAILFCRSDLKRSKEASMRSRFQERFESDLKYASESIHKKRGTKKYTKVLERIGRLKQKHARVSYLYDIKVKERKGVVTQISWQVKDKQKIDERFSGSYYLRTSRTDLSEQEIWDLYISLTDVEDSFRSMKSYLGLRPNFHQKDERIKGHLFITVLAHHVVNSIQTLLHRNEIYLQWNTIRELLSLQQRVTTEMTSKAGRRIWLRHTSEPEPFHYLAADALLIRTKPLGIKKWKT